jgi:hypothetical protein
VSAPDWVEGLLVVASALLVVAVPGGLWGCLWAMAAFHRTPDLVVGPSRVEWHVVGARVDRWMSANAALGGSASLALVAAWSANLPWDGGTPPDAELLYVVPAVLAAASAALPWVVRRAARFQADPWQVRVDRRGFALDLAAVSDVRVDRGRLVFVDPDGRVVAELAAHGNPEDQRQRVAEVLRSAIRHAVPPPPTPARPVELDALRARA